MITTGQHAAAHAGVTSRGGHRSGHGADAVAIVFFDAGAYAAAIGALHSFLRNAGVALDLTIQHRDQVGQIPLERKLEDAFQIHLRTGGRIGVS